MSNVYDLNTLVKSQGWSDWLKKDPTICCSYKHDVKHKMTKKKVKENVSKKKN